MRAANLVGQDLAQQFGPQEWIAQILEGVARVVDQGIKQLAQTAAPVQSQPFSQGGQYHFEPLTEHNAQQHMEQNPAAHSSHLSLAGNVQQANNFYESGQIGQFAQQAQVADPVERQDDGDQGPVPELW